MTGSGLFDFVITLIVLIAAGVMFFLVIDRAAPDSTMNRVAKIAVGVVFAVLILLMIKGLLFGGAGAAALSAGSLIGFAIGIIIILVVLYILDIAIGFIASLIGEQLAQIVKVVVFAIILIALLVLVDKTMMGGKVTGAAGIDLGPTPQIMKQERGR